MGRMTRRASLFGLTLAAGLALVATAHAGPPWIAIEYPPNPFDQATRDALAVVHTYHHGNPTAYPIEGRAVGLVNGSRRSIPLEMRATSQPGVFAVHGELPDEGVWVIAVDMTDEENHIDASVLLALDEDGEPVGIRVPSTVQDGWIVPQRATDRDVEELLRSSPSVTRARQEADFESGTGPSSRLVLAGLGLLLLPVGAAAIRRRRC